MIEWAQIREELNGLATEASVRMVAVHMVVTRDPSGMSIRTYTLHRNPETGKLEVDPEEIARADQT